MRSSASSAASQALTLCTFKVSQFNTPSFLSYEFALPLSLMISGADVVEVAPAYDQADITSIAAADIVHDFLSLFVSAAPPKPRRGRHPQKDEL